MKKILLRILVLILTVSLFAAPLALADETDSQVAEVQLNGKAMDFPSGVLPFYDAEAGKVYVPFRDLFEALGYEVDYNDETSVVSAALDEISIEFDQNNSDVISVTQGDKHETLTMDVPAITVDGRVLVPVRFVSETIGANVGWDQANKTVIILDARSLLAGDTSEYTILDKLLKMQDVDGNYAGTAVLDFDFSAAGSDGESYSLPIDMTMDIVASGTAFDAKFNVKADLAGLLGNMMPGLTAAFDLDGEMIMNLETGLIAFKSDALLSMLDPTIEAGTWLTMDFSELYSEMMPEIGSYEYENAGDLMNELFGYVINSYYLTSIDDYEQLDYMLSMLRGMYSDESFVKNGNDYVSTFEISEDDTSITLIMTVKTNNDGEAIGASIECEGSGDGIDMEISCEFSAKVMSLEMSLVSDELTVEMSLDIKLSETTKEPRTEIPADAPTIDINSFI